MKIFRTFVVQDQENLQNTTVNIIIYAKVYIYFNF